MAAPLADDSTQHAAAVRLMEELHRLGFSSVWMEDVTYFTGGLSAGERATAQVKHHALRLVLSDAEIDPARLAEVAVVAGTHGATVGLTQLRLGPPGSEFSRITLWPKGAATDAD